jgi:hypothetical protein
MSLADLVTGLGEHAGEETRTLVELPTSKPRTR